MYLFLLALLGLPCCGGFSPVVMYRLLIAVASYFRAWAPRTLSFSSRG